MHGGPTGSRGRWRVVAVEDDPDQQLVLQVLLQDEDLDLDVVGGVGEAEALLASLGSAVDLVILDLRLPDSPVPGETARRVRAATDAPIVAYSSSRGSDIGLPDDIRWLDKLGTPADLVVAVRESLVDG